MRKPVENKKETWCIFEPTINCRWKIIKRKDPKWKNNIRILRYFPWIVCAQQAFPMHSKCDGWTLSGFPVARNMGWITTREVFDLMSGILLILGIYSVAAISVKGISFSGRWFIIPEENFLPGNSQAIWWPFALIIAGVLSLASTLIIGRNKKKNYLNETSST